MNRKELTKAFMTISNRQYTFDLHGFYKNISAPLVGCIDHMEHFE